MKTTSIVLFSVFLAVSNLFAVNEKETLKEYFIVYYLGDKATAEKLSYEKSEYEPFSRVITDETQIQKTKESIYSSHLELVDELTTKEGNTYISYIWTVDGKHAFVCAVKNENGFYYDNRWNKSRGQSVDSPEHVVRIFLHSLLRKNVETLQKLLPKGTDVEAFLKNSFEVPNIAHLYMSASEMPVIRIIDEGFLTDWTNEFVTRPYGEADITLMGNYLYKIIPFHLKQEDGKWVVIPYDYWNFLPFINQ